MTKTKFDLIWKEGTFFEKGHWKLTPQNNNTGDALFGYIMTLGIILFLFCVIMLTIPFWAFLVGFSLKKNKSYYASIVSIIGLIYFWIDNKNQWITSYLFYGYENDSGFHEGILNVEYLNYLTNLNLFFALMSLIFLKEYFTYNKTKNLIITISYILISSTTFSQIKIDDKFVLGRYSFDSNRELLLTSNYNKDKNELGINVYDLKNGNLIKNFGNKIIHLENNEYWINHPLVFYSEDYTKIVAIDADGLTGKRSVVVYDANSYKKLNTIIIKDKDGKPPFGSVSDITQIKDGSFSILYGNNVFMVNILENKVKHFLRNSKQETNYVYQINNNSILIVNRIDSYNSKISVIYFNSDSEKTLLDKTFKNLGGYKAQLVGNKLYFSNNSKNIRVIDINNGDILKNLREEKTKEFDIKEDYLCLFSSKYTNAYFYSLDNLNNKIKDVKTPTNHNIRIKNAYIYGDKNIILNYHNGKIILLNLSKTVKKTFHLNKKTNSYTSKQVIEFCSSSNKSLMHYAFKNEFKISLKSKKITLKGRIVNDLLNNNNYLSTKLNDLNDAVFNIDMKTKQIKHHSKNMIEYIYEGYYSFETINDPYKTTQGRVRLYFNKKEEKYLYLVFGVKNRCSYKVMLN